MLAASAQYRPSSGNSQVNMIIIALYYENSWPHITFSMTKLQSIWLILLIGSTLQLLMSWRRIQQGISSYKGLNNPPTLLWFACTHEPLLENWKINKLRNQTKWLLHYSDAGPCSEVYWLCNLNFSLNVDRVGTPLSEAFYFVPLLVISRTLSRLGFYHYAGPPQGGAYTYGGHTDMWWTGMWNLTLDVRNWLNDWKKQIRKILYCSQWPRYPVND